MICGNCGKEIPEGLDYCEECGAPASEPIIVTSVAAKATKGTNNVATVGNDGAFFNLKNYVSALTFESYRIMALVAGIMMYLSPFLFWVWEVTGSQKKKANLFNIGSKNGVFAMNSIKITLLAIVMMACGLGMIIYSARNYIRPVALHSNKKMIWVGIEVVAVIAFLLIRGERKYKLVIDVVKNDVAIAKNHGANVVAKWGLGPGFFLAIIALVLFFFSLFMGVLNTSEVDRQSSL